MKHQNRTQSEVLEWLLKNHPALHLTAEIDRGWLWISADLSGDHNKATRESIKAYGFRFKRNGVHILPSGRGGNWSNACEKPLRFIKRGGSARHAAAQSAASPSSHGHRRADPLADHDMALDDIAAAFA